MPSGNTKIIERLNLEKQRLLAECDDQIAKLTQEMTDKAQRQAEDLKQDQENLDYLQLKKQSLNKL